MYPSGVWGKFQVSVLSYLPGSNKRSFQVFLLLVPGASERSSVGDEVTFFLANLPDINLSAIRVRS